MKLVTAVAIVLLLALTGCGPAPEAVAETEEQETKVVAMPVEIELSQRASVSHYYHTTATLIAPEEAQVIARVNGMVDKLHAEEGDRVVAGQALASIDPKHYRLNLSKAQAELDVIDQELSRMKAIANQQLVSEEAMAKLEFRRQSAIAERDLAKLKLEYSTVSSPISGIVAKRMINRGNVATEMQTPLFHIVQQQQLHAIVHLPEQELSNARVGQTAQLAVDGSSNNHQAEVLRIAPIVDSSSGTVKITLLVDNQAGLLRSGMLTKAKLQFDAHHNTVVMPRQALIRQDNGYAVFVVAEQQARLRNITLGYQEDNQVEVLSGLSADEQVVIRGQHQLKDEADVAVINPVQMASAQ